ncbi:MAG: collagen-like protein [Bacteroidota bacterium]
MFTFQFNKSITFTFIALLGILMSSCVGPRGPQGPAGQDGFDGRDGADGNANVISINYAADPSHWYDVGAPGEDGYFMALDLDVPEITQDIVSNGLVLVYYRADTQDPWTALPYTIIAHNPDYIEKLDFIYDLAFVGLQSQASDRNATAYEGIIRVIVASAVPVGKMEVDYSNYDEVATYLGIYENDQKYRLANKFSKHQQ